MLVDAYVHVGVPRFQTVSDAIAVMESAGIEKALVCPFTTCPDLATVHSAIAGWPDRFVAAGLPVGVDRDEVTAGMRAQFSAGFAGMRLSGEDVRDRPWVLDVIGEHHGFAIVCGSNGLADNATTLLAHLSRYPDGLVVGGHFAGPREPEVLDRDEDVHALFTHDRFLVVFSRHGLFPEPLISQWASSVVALVGWDRLVWGSEAPVLHWREETIASAVRWVDRFAPTAAQREAFFARTAEERILDRPTAPCAPLHVPFDPFDHVVAAPAQMWPHGLGLDPSLPARMVRGWLAWGGPLRGTLGGYIEHVLRAALPR
ncbi:hypothetical protein BJF90_13900 [Pseudonocardia sp. CNS-004]|nr:hypothetical protein BJF90_13900 [Pseudonocardia sp. CNS-004]